MLLQQENCRAQGCLDDANAVSNIQSIKVLCQSHISFLLAIRSDQGVNFLTLDFIKILNCLLYLSFVGLDVYNENKGVVVFNLLHSRFGGQREFNDSVFVHFTSLWDRFLRELGSSFQFEGLWSVEVCFVVDLCGLLMRRLCHCCSSLLCFS